MNARSFSPLSLIKYSVLWLLAFALVLFPLWLVVVNSFKPLIEAQDLNGALPREWAIWENYAAVFESGNLGVTVFNSLLVTAVSVFFLLLFGGAASWVFARHASHRAVRSLYGLSIAGIMLPPAIVTTIPILRFIGVDGTRVGLIIFYVSWMLSLTIFLCVGFVKTIPREVEEAARLDGANNVRLYFSVVLPLMRPVLISIGTYLTIAIWNELFYALFIVHGAERQTVVLGLFRVASGGYQQLQWQLIFAYLVISTLPLLLVLIIGPRRIVSGITSGALK